MTLAAAVSAKKSGPASSPAPAPAPATPAGPDSDAQLATKGSEAVAFYDGARGREYDKGNGSTGAKGQEITVSAVPKDSKASIRTAVTRAKAMVPGAISRCQAAIGTADAAVEHAFKLPAVGDGDRKKALDKVVENYQKVASALAGNLGFEGEDEPVEDDGSYTVAYVYTGFIGLFDGKIHICFPGWNNVNSEEQATTIIHELTHQKCGTADNAYMHESGKWAKMSTKDAVDNAASYEYPCLH